MVLSILVKVFLQPLCFDNTDKATKVTLYNLHNCAINPEGIRQGESFLFADLHIHSRYSDGTQSLEEIIEKAKDNNVTLISICDHNMTDAYAEMENLRSANDIKIIHGVEITSSIDDTEYHILAYGLDLRNDALINLLQYNRNVNIDMGNNLIKEMAIDYPCVSVAEFTNYERNRKRGGWDSIDYLRNKGLVTDWMSYTEFARKYASPLKNDFMSPKDVIDIIHDAGGYAVLAHLCHHVKPNISDYKMKAAQFLDMGIDGFECYYPSCPPGLTEFLVEYCHKHDLMITAGSDEHGGFIGAPGDEYYIGAVKTRIGQLNLRNLISA